MKKKSIFRKIPAMAAFGAVAFSVPAFADNVFYINNAGYDWDQPITIVVKSDQNLEGAKWTLWYAPNEGMTGASVATGEVGKGTNPDNWTNNGKFYVIDLSGKIPSTPSEAGEKPMSGNYHVEISAGSPSGSAEFYIGANTLAQKTLSMVMDYFYNDRATNQAIVSQDQKIPVYGSSGVTRDVHGGWYDASGDVSKYLSHLSYANYLNPQQIPLTVWSLAFAAEHIPQLLGQTSTKAKTADEAAFGADFLVRMLDDQGFFYMTVFDNWGSPTGKRELCAFTGSDGVKSKDYQTAFREGGGMAIAGLARVAHLEGMGIAAKGDYTTAQYLDAAKKAYEHLASKQSIGGNCEYCDDHKENIIDDYTALLAATELYIATGKSQYLTDAQARAEHLAGRLSDDGYFWSDDDKKRPFWHASDAGLPLMALVRYLEAEAMIDYEPCLGGQMCPIPGEDIMKAARAAVEKHLKWLVSITNKVENPFGYARQTYKTNNAIKDGFFIPHDNESGYWWQGEDARLASLAAAAIYAANALESLDDDVKKYAADQLDWILGKNPYSTCMMYGIGKKNPAVYDGQSNYDATLKGGIANGITGKNNDGSGIAWTDDGVGAVGFDAMKESWQVWRWDEQWLPHTTWFMMALATRYDENKPFIYAPAEVSIPQAKLAATGFDVKLAGRTLTVNVANAKSAGVTVVGLDGRKVTSGALTAGRATFNLESLQGGVYLVKVEGLGAKKIVVR